LRVMHHSIVPCVPSQPPPLSLYFFVSFSLSLSLPLYLSLLSSPTSLPLASLDGCRKQICETCLEAGDCDGCRKAIGSPSLSRSRSLRLFVRAKRLCFCCVRANVLVCGSSNDMTNNEVSNKFMNLLHKFITDILIGHVNTTCGWVCSRSPTQVSECSRALYTSHTHVSSCLSSCILAHVRAGVPFF
jgi:hypothetical protein